MIRTVIFDYSGVLVNDLRQSWEAISRIIGLRGYKPDDLNSFRRNFRLPYWDYFMDKGLSEREAKDESVVHDYVRFYNEQIEYVKPFEDVTPALLAFAEKGIELAVVSHSPRNVIDTTMARFGMSRFFKRNCIFSLGDYKREKPNPDSILLALNRLGYSAQEAVYVGDMREDIVAARRAGVRSIAIYREGASYHILQYLKDENPTFLIQDMRELIPIGASDS